MTAFVSGLLGLLGLGLPIGLAMALVGLIGVWLAGVPATIVVQRMAFGLDSFTLVQIPLFLLMGNLMNVSGVTGRIYDFCAALIGHWRAGLAQVNVAGSAVFSGLSGSALADAAGMGTIEIKAMVRHGYPPAFSAAITAASASLGPIIPPSIAAVLYAFIANVSVGRMLVAGVIPGILMAIAMMVTIRLRARAIDYPVLARPPLRVVARTGFFALPALAAPILLIGGMRTGWFTPTEVAAVAVVYAMLLGLLYREMTARGVVEALRETALNTGAIMIIVAGAYAFAWILARQQIPQQVTQVVIAMNLEPWQFLVVVNAVLLLLGMVLDTTAILILVTPVIVPAAAALGIDLIHFGMVMIVNLCIGLLTPPVGMALFVVARIAGVPIGVVAREAFPYVMALTAVLALLIAFPQLVLVLPNLVYGS
jgi:tripartite ATP-independent transporter DctM subunit